MKRVFIILLTLQTVVCNVSYSQSKQGNQWITGLHGNKVDFNNMNITTYSGVYSGKYFYTGNSNICDTNGNLLLCSDGFNVYDSNGNYIDDGDTLVNKDYYNFYDGWSLYNQTSIFLPMDSGIYYFVTPSYSEGNQCYGCPFDIMLYNVIDMNANAGAGKVTKRMQPFLTNASLSRTQMMACRHTNGKDWWLLKQQGGDSNGVYKFLFTQDSVYNYGIQKFDAPVWGFWDIRGQSMFSQDGRKYASTVQGTPAQGLVFIADFDRCYSELSNPTVVTIPLVSAHDPNDTTQKDYVTVGLAFSPNGKLLYVVSPYNLFQYDLQDNTWYHVAGLDTSWLEFQLYVNAYLAQNNKMYIGNFGGQSTQMSVINNPDIKGAGCNFCPRCLRLDTVGFVGTPPCMPNYSLGADSCWPVGLTQHEKDNILLEVFPNPSSTILHIKSSSKDNRELYNSIGQLLFSTKENEIEVRNLAKGMYYLKVGNSIKKVIIE